MNIDDRLEALAARHEALAQSVELLRDTAHETSTAVELLRDSVNGLTGMLKPLLEAMHTLADAVNSHERRITNLEDGRA